VTPHRCVPTRNTSGGRSPRRDESSSTAKGERCAHVACHADSTPPPYLPWGNASRLQDLFRSSSSP
ncbi:unnamed protein product, partial [Musa textilis]